MYFRSCWAERWKLHHIQSSAVRLCSPKPAEMAKGTLLLMETDFFLLRFQQWAWRCHERSFLKRLFPDNKISNVEPTCTGELSHHLWALRRHSQLPTLWADEPTAPHIKALSDSRERRYPQLAILICVASHLTNLGFCGMERDSGGSELWDEMP